MMFYRMMRRNPLKLSGDRSAALDLARGRLVLMSGFFMLLYCVLAIRIFDLGFIQAYAKGAESEMLPLGTAITAEEKRGKIYDRNGNILAVSLPMASLYADPALISDPQNAAAGLSEIFPDISYGRLLQNLQSQKRFVWIKRNITPADQAKIMNLGEPGLAFQVAHKRMYPMKNATSHLVGYTNIDGKGLSGLERSFDKLLSRGDDLTLSLDVRLQHIMQRELQKAIDDFNAKAAVGIVLDAKTGEVLAGVSLPDFNPHDVGSATKDQHFNRITMGAYELGSVFKIFSTAAFLETHDVPMSTTFDAREAIKIGRFTINDYHAEERLLTIPEVFMFSSNIGSAMMGQAVGGERLQQFYDDLGLLRPMDLEIAEIATPLTPDRWGEIATMTASYGHGIATTPLQVAAAVGTLANGGYILTPTLIKHATNQQNNDRVVRIISDKNADKIKQLMHLTVAEGTGGNAEVEGYYVGGKTGTAEKSTAGGYDRTKLISSFAGAFPMDDPQYIIFVAVDEPKGNKKSFGYATAGWVAAPVTARVVKAMAGVLGLPPHYAPHYQVNPLKQYVAVKG